VKKERVKRKRERVEGEKERVGREREEGERYLCQLTFFSFYIINLIIFRDKRQTRERQAGLC